MLEILIRAAAFVLIILTGYLLKKNGVFGEKDFKTLSTIILKITLPAAIVSNLSRTELDISMLVIAALGIFANVIFVSAGYLLYKNGTKEEKAFGVLNISGHNIGNFTLPFVQNFLGPVGFAATSLFDSGNAVMCLGLTYIIVQNILGLHQKFSLKNFIYQLISSIPFTAYIVMVILGLLEISLPEIVINYADIAGSANAFLGFLMIGIGFELHFEKDKIKTIAKILTLRYLISLSIAIAAFFLLPFELEVKQAVVLAAMSPIASVAVAYTGKTKGDVGISGAINSMSIVISIVLMTLALILML